eukprot:7352173-Pyramimonas_sp.AAC.2
MVGAGMERGFGGGWGILARISPWLWGRCHLRPDRPGRPFPQRGRASSAQRAAATCASSAS